MTIVGADDWNGRTGLAWAEEWRRTDRSFGPLTEHLLRRSRGLGVTRVLDVGCGAGELSLAIARGRPRAQVVGVDLSAPLIAVARERASHLGNVEFVCADAAGWQPAEGFAPDLVISRHGAMFFEQPVAALAHLAALAAPAATLLASCFRDRAENPLFTELPRLLHADLAPVDPGAPGPFGWADRHRVEQWLAEAGWRDIGFEPFDFAMVIGAGADPIADAVGYCLRIGPAARAAAELDDDGRARFVERAAVFAERHNHEGIVALRAAAWIVTARKP